jgi:hypothetical protein
MEPPVHTTPAEQVWPRPRRAQEGTRGFKIAATEEHGHHVRMGAFRTGVRASLPIALVTTNTIEKHTRISLLTDCCMQNLIFGFNAKARSAPLVSRQYSLRFN